MLLRFSILSLAILGTVGCHSYTPMPVELDEHLDAFLRRTPPSVAGGMTRGDARELAKVFHPDARLARLRAGVATAQRDYAGTWVDPQLQTNLQRIIPNVPAQWVHSVGLAFTIPINGRLQKQRVLADRKREAALVDAWAIEQQVANDLDTAWVHWSAAQLRATLFAATCDNLARLEDVANALVTTGGLSKPGARVFTLERNQKEAARDMAAANEQAARLEVLRRMGLHPDAELALQPQTGVQPFVGDAQGRRTAVQTSPRLMQQRLAHATAEANLDLQVRKQWPDLQLAPGWTHEDGDLRAVFGLNVPLPMSTGNDPAIAKAVAQRKLTAAALRAELEELTQELAIAEVRHAAASEQAKRLTALLEVARMQVEDGRQLAAAGQLDPMLMLDALLRVHNVQLQAIAADVTAALATIKINTLLTDPQSREPQADEGDER